MRTWPIIAASSLVACIVGEDPNFMGGRSSGDSSSADVETGTGESSGDETGTTETGTTDATDTGDTETGGDPVHRIFVTSTLYDGDLGGLAGADAECQMRADAVNLGGTWKALLSAGGTNARDRIIIEAPVVNLLDEPVAADATDLWDTMIDNPVLYDENQTASPGDVWTGSTVDANASGVDCSGWTKTAASGSRGGAEDANNDWLNRGFRFCDWTLALYCVSQ